MPIVEPQECDLLVAAFLRSRGVTRCPTACAQPTQATPVAADRAALADHAAQRQRRRAHRTAVSIRRLRNLGIPTRYR